MNQYNPGAETAVRSPLKVLMVEDNPADAELLVMKLKGEGFSIDYTVVETEEEFINSLPTGHDLVLSDWFLPQFSGLRALEIMRERQMKTPFIIISGNIGEEAAVNALHQGADDYLLKGRLDRLGQAVRNALEREHLRKLRLAQEMEKESLQKQLLQAQKMEAIGRLAGGVAHDFNNWLAVIMGRAEIGMSKTRLEEPVYRDLNEILESAKHAASLVRQLLAYARKQTASPRILDLNAAISEMLPMLGRMIGENIQLVWAPEPSPAYVLIDPSQIDQILVNLVINARDALAGAGKIWIETGSIQADEEICKKWLGLIPGEHILLTVNDNGKGMDEETVNHLFEPFFTTKEIGRGTGLGLATVYGIVKQNNGYIDAQSKIGHGSTMRIFLPKCAPPLDGAEARCANESADTIKSSASGTETVLLVEDEPALLEMIRDTLEESGYHVWGTSLPAEAICKAQENAGNIHLLITDVVMPGMNGRELAEKIKAFQPGVKLLFMSGYTADIISNQGVLPEGVQFIQKPFLLDELSIKVRQVLG